MASDVASEVKLEIGHVLFIDVVGYSQLLITQQSEQLEMLRRIVRSTVQFQVAEAEGKLLRLPTGDGERWYFELLPKRQLCAHSRLRKNLKNIPSFGCEWEFTAVRLMRSPI